MTRMLAKLSTRRYSAGLEPVGAEVDNVASATSKSAVSRRFVTATETALADLLGADLSELDPVALMIDGVHFGEHLCVVALGIGIDGTKHPLAVVDGSTENATVVTDLLVGLRDRGLDVTLPILVVVDGAKAPRRPLGRCSTIPSSLAANSTKSETSRRNCPKAWPIPWRRRCTPPTGSTPPCPLRPPWRTWPASSIGPIPAPPGRCARDSKRPSRSCASACRLL